jgi:NADH:ubiquinone oxidoreductase subunit 2 (subunit N)
LFFYTCNSKTRELIYNIDFIGLGKLSPKLGILYTIVFLSMAGLPPMVGFFTKYFIFVSLVKEGFYFLTLYAIVLSVITSFVYIRLVKLIWFETALNANLIMQLDKDSDNKLLAAYLSFKTNTVLSMGFVFVITFFFFNPDFYFTPVYFLTDSLIRMSYF